MQTITTFDNTAEGWERGLCAFLAEKERRSGSRRPHARRRHDLVYRYRVRATSRVSASCQSPRTWRSQRRCRPSGGTSRPCVPGCVAMAVQRGRRRSDLWHVLRQPSALPEGGGTAAGRPAHLPALSGQAASRCGRVHRERLSLSRPLVIAGDVDLCRILFRSLHMNPEGEMAVARSVAGVRWGIRAASPLV